MLERCAQFIEPRRSAGVGGLGAALGTLGAMLVTTTAACFLSGAPRKLFGSLPAPL